MRAFGAGDARRLGTLYLTPDVVEQRRRLLDALQPRPGDRVLDVGSGPGFLAADLAGRGAEVLGVDLGEAMVEAAQERVPDAEFRQGDATDLPFADASFDAVTCTQVLEYVEDVPAALREFLRVLKPGGRAAVVDTDWDSAVWAGADRELTRRVLEAWEPHFVDAHLPPKLPALLREAGFHLEQAEVIAIVNLEPSERTYSGGMLETVARFTEKSGLAEAADWRRQLEAAAAEGRYFFSLNRYLFVARRA